MDVLEADNARLRADAEANGAAHAVFSGSSPVPVTGTTYDPLTGPLAGDNRPPQGAGFLDHDDPPPR